MLDFLHKDIVQTWTYTTAGQTRSFEKEVLVNGHRSKMQCNSPFAVMEGVLYKVYDHSVKSLKYVLHIGIGEQDIHENGIISSEKVALLTERAVENMLTSPIITMTFDDNPKLTQTEFNKICDQHCSHNTKAMMTLEEVHADANNCRYGRKYPYDWAYFKIYDRRITQDGI